MKNDNLLTLLVNSTDYYADAWDPFFRLLEIHWPDRKIPAVLNTESKDPEQAWPGVSVHHNGMRGGKLLWPECLGSALDAIATPYVLYVQEDLFLNRRVEVERLDRFIGVLETGAVDVIHCREVGIQGKYLPTAFPGLLEVPRSHGYYGSLQAGIWRKDALRGLLRSGETAWHFERQGTRRARKSLKAVFAPDPSVYENWDSGTFSYEPTGIVRGQWYRPAVEDLFRQHGIDVDFSIRGFYEPTAWQQFKQRQRSLVRRVLMRF